MTLETVKSVASFGAASVNTNMELPNLGSLFKALSIPVNANSGQSPPTSPFKFATIVLNSSNFSDGRLVIGPVARKMNYVKMKYLDHVK